MSDATTCDVDGCNARAIAELYRSGPRCKRCLAFDLGMREV